MSVSNTRARFGSVAKIFHWLTALLILTAIPLGIVASDLAEEIANPAAKISEALVNRTFLLFSLHKTIGVAVFFVALARIAWALSQPKPGLLNGNHKAEALAAETVHWMLYAALVVVPLSGWVYHAATTGFAPIWWPFGQSLPLVPKSDTVAAAASGLHHLSQWVLFAALALHVAGALKHHVIDGDATLRRMLPGRISAEPTAEQPRHWPAIMIAIVLWSGTLAGGALLGMFTNGHDSQTTATAQTETPATPQNTPSPATDTSWVVDSGTLGIGVTQMNTPVSGAFADWNAQITFSEIPDADGRHGAVTVTVQIPSLSIGAATTQALGTDMLNATNHPVAEYSGDIFATEAGYVVRGQLVLRGESRPADLPFELVITDNIATAQGTVLLDRRDFGIGAGVKDAGSLGFDVSVTFDLTAHRP